MAQNFAAVLSTQVSLVLPPLQEIDSDVGSSRSEVRIDDQANPVALLTSVDLQAESKVVSSSRGETSNEVRTQLTDVDLDYILLRRLHACR